MRQRISRVRLLVSVLVLMIGLAACQPTTEVEPVIKVTLDKLDDTAVVSRDVDRTIIDVTSARGIGGLQAELVAGQWPDEVVVRLHLTGLESLEIGYDQVLVRTGVSSTSDPAPLPIVYAIDDANRAQEVFDAGEAFYPSVIVVPEEGSQASIPLQNGYFEISLPPNFYDGRPDAFTMQWIDFYR